MSNNLSSCKELNKLVTKAEAAGWKVTKTKNNHICFRNTEGGMTFVSSTPSDGHAVKNATNDLRKMGLT